MFTQCPACHARAQLADQSAGVKVRCGECGRAYVALPAAGKPHRLSRSRTGVIVAVLAALAGGVALPLLKRASGRDAPAQAEPGAQPPAAEPAGLPEPSGG